MAGRMQTSGNEGALTGTAEGDTVARTQRAGKAQFSVYEQITQVDVYDADVEVGSEGAEPRAAGVTVLVLIATDVEARRGVDACWSVAEGTLRDRAESSHPPVLIARNQKDGGTSDPKPYALEKVVQRKRAS
jgi:hypothetical protein